MNIRHLAASGWIVVVLVGCAKHPDSYGSAETDRNSASDDRYRMLYDRWQNATKDIHASKTTAYTDRQEFADIVGAGPGIIPFLHAKIKADQGMDFVLSFAVIQIMKWPREQFEANNITELRNQVLARLEARP